MKKATPIRSLLSGDFESPSAILASDLEESAKAQILETWLSELQGLPGEEALDLWFDVKRARAKIIDAETQR